jgi:hypothetical protein
MVLRGRSMRWDWKIGWSIYTVASIGERFERYPHGECTSRKPTVGNDRWGWLPWRTS